MEAVLFERLLYEEESPTLDFKAEQYAFSKAPEDEKSELLKDLLGFVNAWRRAEAYILIGVKEVRGGRSEVIGILSSEQLADHSLQQFVNNLTNRPVRFHYEAFGVEGKQVGIIRIEQQPRPVYLKRDYGILKKNEVYVRRGTSTDPSKPASLEEIAQMGQMAAPEQAELSVEFAHLEDDGSFGAVVTWDAEFCEMPPADEIPKLDLSRHVELQPGRSFVIPDVSLDRPNPSFYRQLAEYHFVRRLFRPVRLVVRNIGQIAAKNVRCELSVVAGTGIHIMDSSDLPEVPKMRSQWMVPPIKGLRRIGGQTPGEVTIDRNEERYCVEIDCGSLQPGRAIRSAQFLIGKTPSGESELAGRLYADNLPQPKDFILTIRTAITRTSMTVDDLVRLGEPEDDD